ncbi:MAG TPA: nitrous oxide reductase accessory protein NosL [Magnetospirillum sp.]|nr:nitrous oxide reductase accessory protein NosL [Magnetospirillum sp.]
MNRFAPLLVAVLLSACGKPEVEVPPPVAIPPDAIGHFCNMAVAEHAGPKGEVMLKSGGQPVWFTSARDAIAFTLLPEEPKDILAVYVSDMGKSSSWDRPDAWVEARTALFVIGSNRVGGMGSPEAIPFSERPAAEAFIAAHGGQVVDFAHLPHDYILGSGIGGGHGGH